jgi:Mn2+/Fe2+ NRAMP family transporter
MGDLVCGRKMLWLASVVTAFVLLLNVTLLLQLAGIDVPFLS